MDLIELKNMGFDPSTIIDHLNEILDFSEEPEKSQHAHSSDYSREKRAMAATPADVKEYPEFIRIRDGHAWVEVGSDKSAH